MDQNAAIEALEEKLEHLKSLADPLDIATNEASAYTHIYTLHTYAHAHTHAVSRTLTPGTNICFLNMLN